MLAPYALYHGSARLGLISPSARGCHALLAVCVMSRDLLSSRAVRGCGENKCHRPCSPYRFKCHVTSLYHERRVLMPLDGHAGHAGLGSRW
eukprot:2846518-Rhodomonas_salina.1